MMHTFTTLSNLSVQNPYLMITKLYFFYCKCIQTAKVLPQSACLSMHQKRGLVSSIYRSLLSSPHLTAYTKSLCFKVFGNPVLWMDQTLSYCNHRFKIYTVMLCFQKTLLNFSDTPAKQGITTWFFQTIRTLSLHLFVSPFFVLYGYNALKALFLDQHLPADVCSFIYFFYLLIVYLVYCTLRSCYIKVSLLLSKDALSKGSEDTFIVL